MKEFPRIRRLTGMIGLLALCGCGSFSTGPNPQPSSTPPPTPTPTPTPFATLCGSPAPPPLIGMRVSVQTAVNPTRWLLDSRPLVKNVNGYCQQVGLSGRQCDTRPEGNPQREACDALVVGKSKDTGRVGPTWSDPEGKSCLAPGETGTQVSCINTENQFLVVARGTGQFLACASEDWPLAEPDSVSDGGARCGGCTLKVGQLLCD